MTDEAWHSADSLELVRRAQEGELSALNPLFARYYPRVRRIVKLRIGPELGRQLQSDDILQETFIAAVNAFDRFELRDESSLIHWLSKIAENQIRKAVAKNGALKRDKRREVGLQFVQNAQASGELVLEPEAPVVPPIEELEKEEDIQDVEACLAQLREKHREVVLLHDYIGVTWERAASELGLSTPVAARSLYVRAIAELTKLMHKRRSP